MKTALQAQAAQLNLEGAMKDLEAATLRGDCDEMQRLRMRAHDLLDSIMDLKTEAMVLVLLAGEGR